LVVITASPPYFSVFDNQKDFRLLAVAARESFDRRNTRNDLFLVPRAMKMSPPFKDAILSAIQKCHPVTIVGSWACAEPAASLGGAVSLVTLEKRDAANAFTLGWREEIRYIAIDDNSQSIAIRAASDHVKPW